MSSGSNSADLVMIKGRESVDGEREREREREGFVGVL
jgi:hypothetical protein